MASDLLPSSDRQLLTWNNLQDQDKEIYLREQCKQIDRIRFIGRKSNTYQKLAFPRTVQFPPGVYYIPWVQQYCDNQHITINTNSNCGLDKAKEAQVVNAVYASYFREMQLDRTEINIQGLTSKKLGPTSEQYSKPQRELLDSQHGIYTPLVMNILIDWISDSRFQL